MAITSTDIPQIVINKMSTSKYEELKTAGQLVDNEFYITPDGGTIPEVNNNTNQQVLSNNGTDLLWRDEQIGYKQITNCITEIPQDIKLELNNGIIYVKTGSKIYFPDGKDDNGNNKYKEVILTEDIQSTQSGTNTNVLLLLSPDLSTGRAVAPTAHFSGDTDPNIQSYIFWYDTSTNYIKFKANAETEYVSGYSFPVCIETQNEGLVTSIDQVFNGFGYIGSTIFALPGVKGLSPNGIDSLTGIKKNNIISIENILIYTCPNITANIILDLYTNKIAINSKAFDKPTTDLIFFDEINNYNYSSLEISNDIWVGSARIENGKIVLFNPKYPISLVDKNDSSWIAQQVMPSKKFIALTMGASGATYIAPANGYISISGIGPNWVDVAITTDELSYGYCYASRSSDKYVRTFIPVSKGNTYTIYFDVAFTNLISFNFIYAEGEL